jgi:methionyl-tRNA formyltransferase
MVPRLAAGTAPREPQDHAAARYFGGRTAADGEIDWAEPAESIRNLVRAVTRPWPGAFGQVGGQRVSVWWAEVRPGSASPGALVAGDDGVPLVGTGDGLLELVEVSGEGGALLSGRAWLDARGVRDS